MCKLDHPLVSSADDIILSTCSLPLQTPIVLDKSENKTAPKVDNNRVKIKCLDGNVPLYQDLIGENLTRLRNTWSDTSSTDSISMLLISTNDVLNTTAAASNKIIHLGKHFHPKPVENSEVSAAQAKLLRLSKLVKQLSSSLNCNEPQLLEAKHALTAARSALKRFLNASTQKDCDD